MIVEMRTYRIKPGRRAEFLEIFHRQSVPAHAEIGMKILGPFLSIEDPDVFTRPWKISLPLYRHTEPNFQILEYECEAYADEAAKGSH